MSRGFGPDELLACYARGVFPMANTRDDPRLFLIDPDRRGVLPLKSFHISKSLKRLVRRDPFEIRINTAFTDVVKACAQAAPGREQSWINDPVIDLYSALHYRGEAHSVECWNKGELVGGLYGVSLGAAFFGESMFSRQSNASKLALVHLVARLIAGGYRLLDTQFVTEHLRTFGVVEISRRAFQDKLSDALAHHGDFLSQLPSQLSGASAVQLITQTS